MRFPSSFEDVSSMQRVGKLTEHDMINGGLKTVTEKFLPPNGVNKLSFPTYRSSLTGWKFVTMTVSTGSDTIALRR
jgi:hypothetical protein